MFLASKATLMDETIESKKLSALLFRVSSYSHLLQCNFSFWFAAKASICMYEAHAYSFRMHTADISCSLYRPIHFKRFDIGVNIFYILFNLFINAILLISWHSKFTYLLSAYVRIIGPIRFMLSKAKLVCST